MAIETAGWLRGYRVHVNGELVAEWDAFKASAAAGQVISLAWPRFRAVTAREIEVWQALSALRP